MAKENKETKAGTDKEVLSALEGAAKGLLFPSESDKPVKAFLWKGQSKNEETTAVTADTLKAVGKVPEQAEVTTQSVKEFFEPVTQKQDWFGEEETKTAERFQALVNVLEQHLEGASVFRIAGRRKGDAGDGGAFVTVYIAGCTADGDLAGVTTQVIET